MESPPKSAARPGTSADDQGFLQLTAMLRRACGIVIGDDKRSMVTSRLQTRMRKIGVADFVGYARHIESDRSELGQLVDMLSTNVTSFFRENHHFEFLKSTVLPRAKAHGRPLRFWSSACSSGQEPYTISIVLAENLAAEQLGSARVLATDISRRILRAAKEGRYGPSQMSGIDAARRSRWFERVDGAGDTLRIAPSVAQRVRFRHLNLIGSWPMQGRFDAIFCRNVLIYFDTPTREAIIRRMADYLLPGGVLLLGHSESIQAKDYGLNFIAPTVYERPH